MTSDPDEARAFIDRFGLGRVICKAFSATLENWRETRMIGETEYALLDQVAVAPVIFQEFVPAEVDLRITVVGEELFVGEIHSQELDYPLDFRLFLETGSGVRMTPGTAAGARSRTGCCGCSSRSGCATGRSTCGVRRTGGTFSSR